jgi:hypothetical protein
MNEDKFPAKNRWILYSYDVKIRPTNFFKEKDFIYTLSLLPFIYMGKKHLFDLQYRNWSLDAERKKVVFNTTQWKTA